MILLLSYIRVIKALLEKPELLNVDYAYRLFGQVHQNLSIYLTL